MKTKYAFLILGVLFILGGVFNNTTTLISKPMGTIFFALYFIFILFLALVVFSTALRKTLAAKKDKRRKRPEGVDSIGLSIFVIIVCLVLLFFPLRECYFAIVDLIAGPKEIVLHDAWVKRTRSHGRYGVRINYYLIGETSTHEKKGIRFYSPELKEDILKELKKSNEIKVSYFEALNEVYLIKID